MTMGENVLLSGDHAAHHHHHHHLTNKVVDDDVLLPGDHVALLLSAFLHPVVSVRPEHGLFKQLTLVHSMHQDQMIYHDIFSKD